MPTWTLIALIAAAWLTYPFFGAAGVSAQKAVGKADPNAGFSFLPELIIYPPIFYGVAAAIDYIAAPAGRWIVACICITMLVGGTIGFVRNINTIRRHHDGG